MTQSHFDFDGYLVFSPSIASSRGRFEDFNSMEFEGNILKKLPEYSPGTPEDPQDGFQPKNFQEYLNEIPEYVYVDGNSINNLATFEYIYEEYEETEAYYQGERRTVHLPSKETVDIFWFYPEIILFRGKKSLVNRVRNELQRIYKDDLLLDTIRLSPEFLESLLRDSSHTLKGTKIELKQIRSAKFEGSGEVSEISVSTGHYDGNISDEYISDKITRPKLIQGSFDFCGREVNARISPERIHVRSSQGSLKDIPPIGQMTISILFTKEIVNIALEEPNTTLGDADL